MQEQVCCRPGDAGTGQLQVRLAAASLSRDTCKVKLKLICSWCWLLHHRLVVSVKGCCEETSGGPQKTF